MPSPPSSQSVPQASALALRHQERHEYRQTTYYDGGSVQIAESRRRSWAVRKVEPPVQAYTDFVLYPTEKEYSSIIGSVEKVSQAHPAPRGRTTDASSAHVTPAKHSLKVRSKPVVLHGPAKSSQRLPLETKAPLYTSAGPTPPPTPRCGRLPTPDLSDLDEAPFRECGGKPHVVKFCAECGMKVDLWST
jgi:hypothetical protein